MNRPSDLCKAGRLLTTTQNSDFTTLVCCLLNLWLFTQLCYVLHTNRLYIDVLCHIHKGNCSVMLFICVGNDTEKQIHKAT